MQLPNSSSALGFLRGQKEWVVVVEQVDNASALNCHFELQIGVYLSMQFVFKCKKQPWKTKLSINSTRFASSRGQNTFQFS